MSDRKVTEAARWLTIPRDQPIPPGYRIVAVDANWFVVERDTQECGTAHG